MRSEYIVQFERLGLGEHQFDFTADQNLFEGNEEVLKANVTIDLTLYKTGNMMDMRFEFNGFMTLPCDRCNDPLEMNVNDNSELVVKFGQTEHEDLDDLIVLDDHEYEIDLKQYLYETLSLLIPIRHVHEEKDCNPEILKKINSVEEGKNDIDPRWEKLKEI